MTKPIALTGDAAFINPVSGDRRAREILGELGIDPHARLLGLNITAYMDRWLKPDEKLARDADFVTVMVEGVRRAQAAASEPFTPLVICTQPMDGETCQRLAAAIGGKVLSNGKYLSHDIQAVMRRCQLMVGMRFHSLVLASSVGTPVMALNYAPKVRDYMRLLGCEEFGMELASVTPGLLAARITEAWRRRDELKQRQAPVVEQQKEGAHRAVDLLVARYFDGRQMDGATARATPAQETPGWAEDETEWPASGSRPG